MRNYCENCIHAKDCNIREAVLPTNTCEHFEANLCKVCALVNFSDKPNRSQGDLMCCNDMSLYHNMDVGDEWHCKKFTER